MTALEILEHVNRSGGHLWAEGETLKYKIPEEACSDDLISTMRDHKVELLELIDEQTPQPYLLPDNTLVIPFDSPTRYHWWLEGSLPIKEIREELKQNLIL
ncbi:MAG: hypothetical protein OEM27_08090 [Nitrospinota bacterium]|nr:hypothetical protein [Nitrospinota bacterium]